MTHESGTITALELAIPYYYLDVGVAGTQLALVFHHLWLDIFQRQRKTLLLVILHLSEYCLFVLCYSALLNLLACTCFIISLVCRWQSSITFTNCLKAVLNLERFKFLLIRRRYFVNLRA